ncbi:MAG: hypothetical protein ACOYIA_00470 [Eubacteriales bacterium]|jgi:hypothetical protein
MCDGWYRKYRAPKKKKKSALAWIVAALAFVALCPLAVKRDKEKGEWGIASLLLFVGCRPSAKKEGGRELTISIPGYSHIKSICKSVCGCKKNASDTFEAGNNGDAEDFDLSELMGETSGNITPDVTISEE